MNECTLICSVAAHQISNPPSRHTMNTIPSEQAEKSYYQEYRGYHEPSQSRIMTSIMF